mmetsp:Transcript_4058/g.13389  ORF Transcript_4058/g.13389 Transcript_4058/m.13389 type:complete len:215 (-) Transcript_4058:636-1280(-)
MHRAALPQLQLAAPMLPTGRRPVHHAYKATRMARREATARLAWSRGPTLRPCPHGRPASLAQYGHGSSDALHCPGGSTRPPSVSTPAATPAASPWLRLAGVRPACGPALRLAVPLPAGPKQRRVNDNLGAIPQPVHALDGKVSCGRHVFAVGHSHQFHLPPAVVVLQLHRLPRRGALEPAIRRVGRHRPQPGRVEALRQRPSRVLLEERVVPHQ